MLLFIVQIKPHMIHFQIYKITEMKEFHVEELLNIFPYNVKEMFELCKSEIVKVYKAKVMCIT